MKVHNQLKLKSSIEAMERARQNEAREVLTNAALLDQCREKEEVLLTVVVIWYQFLKALTKKQMLQEQHQEMLKATYGKEGEHRRC